MALNLNSGVLSLESLAGGGPSGGGMLATTTSSGGGGGLDWTGFGNSVLGSFSGAVDQALEFGMPEWLDYDYTPRAGGNGQHHNRPIDYANIDPELLRRINQSNSPGGGPPNNTALYIAGGLALLGVLVVLVD